MGCDPEARPRLIPSLKNVQSDPLHLTDDVALL